MTEGTRNGLVKALETLPDPWSAQALEAAGRLERYLELLREGNEQFNLVSASDAAPDRLVERHLLDSLRGLPFLPPPGGRRLLLDVGSGGGFPAIPLLAVRSDLSGVLVESTGKKARFLGRVVEELGLTARVLNARFPAPALEEMSDLPPIDLLTSRAVADSGRIVRQARPVLAREARALLWTVEALVPKIARESGGKVRFEREPGRTSGIAILECFT